MDQDRQPAVRDDHVSGGFVVAACFRVAERAASKDAAWPVVSASAPGADAHGDLARRRRRVASTAPVRTGWANLMTDYEFPRLPEVEEAYRTAYRALSSLVPANSVTAETSASLPEVLSEFRHLVDRAEFATVGQIGPPVSWEAPRREGDWDLAVSGVDCDNGAYELGDARLGANAVEGPKGTWHGSALDCAGMAYKRACGWDFPPGEAGVWLVMLAPEAAVGGENGLWFYDGRLAGFVVVYDRDKDGDYESVGHIWTATAWQRRGIARRLLAEARSLFPITTVEEPYTDAGAAFLSACPDSGPGGARGGRLEPTVYTGEHRGHRYTVSVDNERNPRRRDWEVVQEHADPDGEPAEDRHRGCRAFASRSAQLDFVRRRLATLSRAGANWTCTGPSVQDESWPSGRPPRLRRSE
uniref:GNAT family N-acetyltransferase n=1 Tax=Amycolatopsis sp. CA-096443 TaxID=3239919 RepID=UPI003F497C58